MILEGVFIAQNHIFIGSFVIVFDNTGKFLGFFNLS